ncbi:hypothetical protein LCGC14_0267680 [marine sediment metagenome]|uniref:Uncharacterized protein n=1 Tax=marine sediment metagenome TaxID=412755 RepID=A0A0F9UGU6_9ZZZZ
MSENRLDVKDLQKSELMDVKNLFFIHYCPSCEPDPDPFKRDGSERGPYFIDQIWDYPEKCECPEELICIDGTIEIHMLERHDHSLKDTRYYDVLDRCIHTDFETEAEAIRALIQIIDEVNKLKSE